jgi:hypothetical protein
VTEERINAGHYPFAVYELQKQKLFNDKEQEKYDGEALAEEILQELPQAC